MRLLKAIGILALAVILMLGTLQIYILTHRPLFTRGGHIKEVLYVWDWPYAFWHNNCFAVMDAKYNIIVLDSTRTGDFDEIDIDDFWAGKKDGADAIIFRLKADGEVTDVEMPYRENTLFHIYDAEEYEMADLPEGFTKDMDEKISNHEGDRDTAYQEAIEEMLSMTSGE